MQSSREIGEIKKIYGENDFRLASIFKVLGDINRFRIVLSLIKETNLRVGVIAKVIDMSLPSASQHLKALELNGVLLKARRGKQVYYSLNRGNKNVKSIIKTLN